MVYRIHFTAQDLARTRVADAPFPLHELAAAARLLQGRGRPVSFDAWRRRAWSQLSPQARSVLSLIPPVGYMPGFLQPACSGPPEEALERVRATPRAVLQGDLADIAEEGPLPAWAHLVPDDAEVHGQFFDGVDQLYELLLAPHWTQISGDVAADRTRHMRRFLTGGVEAVLTQANPQWIRWNAPVLEIRMVNGVSADLHLGGQGLLLVPSVFAPRAFVHDDPEQPTLTYPIGEGQPLRRLSLLTPPPRLTGPGTTAAVAALLGRTRAAVLNAIAEHPGCTTTELAADARIAPASASEHATVLREAGLIRTMRYRNTALHSITELGKALLESPRGRRPPGAET